MSFEGETENRERKKRKNVKQKGKKERCREN
jgi:hypothetical protein